MKSLRFFLTLFVIFSCHVAYAQRFFRATALYDTPATGFSITFSRGSQQLIINPAGILASGTVVFPMDASNGQPACVVSTEAVSSISFVGSSGQKVLGAPPDLPPFNSICFVYVRPIATWIKE